MIRVLLCALLLVVPPTSSGGMSDALLLARIAVAEAGGAALWGSQEAAAEAQVAVMWVVINRMAGWGLSVADVAAGFSTGDRPRWPGLGPYLAALSVLRMDPDESPHDYHYVLSQQDVDNLRFPDGELVMCANDVFALHFYSPGGWPGRVTP